MRYHRLFLLVVLLVSFNVSARDVFSDFDRFEKKVDSDFKTTSSDYEKAYDDAVTKYNKTYKSFTDKIDSMWGDRQTTDTKKWVQYSPDLSDRAVVDFENGVINIETVSSSSNPDINVMKDRLNSILSDTFATAQSKDPVLSVFNNSKGKTDKGKLLSAFLNNDGGSVKKNLANNKVHTSKLVQNKYKHTVKIKLPKNIYLNKAEALKETVLAFSKMYSLPPSLIYAVIHTESAFNPMATSHIPAFGLMQIVPKSAGLDVSVFLTGNKKIYSPDYLYTEDKNIEVGATYLHILNSRYLRSISNPESRIYCIICAYNTGAGNVAKAFIGSSNIKKAAVVINKLSPEQVYNTLIKKLPYEETRKYLKLVSSRKDSYSNTISN